MQNGQVKANVTKSEIDGMGKSLEDLFFEVTEGINKESVSESDSEKTEEKTEDKTDDKTEEENGEA